MNAPRIGLALASAGAVALFAVLVIAPVLDARPQLPSSALASPTSAATATPTPATSAVLPGTFESPILGYRVTLPVTYRLALSQVRTGSDEMLGADFYTPRTEQDEAAACRQDMGDIPSPQAANELSIQAYRDTPSVPLAQWVTAPPRNIVFTSVQAMTINGYEIARVVNQPVGDTAFYAIRANDRIYVLSPELFGSGGDKAWLDGAANSFVALAPRPFPTPTPSPVLSAHDSAKRLRDALAAAFAARDADAVGRLMQQCHIGVGFYVGTMSTGGALNRSVPLFIDGLRDRFARGDLTVRVDVDPQLQILGGTEQFTAHSQWIEPDRTIAIDLDLGPDRDGVWRWYGAMHHYEQRDVLRGCIPLRSPWNSSLSGSC